MNFYKLLKPLCTSCLARQTKRFHLLTSVAIIRKTYLFGTPLAFRHVAPQAHPHALCRQFSSTVSNTDSNYELVYKGSLTKRVLTVKMISVGSSVISLFFLPSILGPVLSSGATNMLILLGCGSGFFIFSTPLILNLLCKRYVTELRFDSERKRFRATVLTLFFRKKHIDFTAKEVNIPMSPLFLTSLHVRGYPLLMNGEDFLDTDAFKHLMGYDKPMDYLLKDKK